MTNGEVINHLVASNDPVYNLSKAAEEATELSLVLLQHMTKGETAGPSIQDIIDEIGDVQIRLQILKEIFGEDKVKDRIQFKLDKYKKNIQNNEYIGHI